MQSKGTDQGKEKKKWQAEGSGVWWGLVLEREGVWEPRVTDAGE